MLNIRTCALALAGAALVAGTQVPASAAPMQAPPDTYAAESTATGLRVNAFGQELSIGQSDASATSPDGAAASGAGAFLVAEGVGESSARAKGAGSSDGSATPVCSPLVLPQQVPSLSLSAACSSAQAAVSSTGSSGDATGQSVTIQLAGDQALAPVVDALPLDEVTGTLLTGLGPLLGQVTPIPPEVIAGQLSDLLGDTLVGDVALLTVEGGATEAHTMTDAATVTATTKSNGVTVKILDRGQTLGGPILTLEVGESTTSVSRDRASGESSTEFSAIPVRITIAPDVAALLQLPQSSFEAPQGQQVDIPLPAPLTSSLILSAGSSTEIDGGARATAATVQLNLLSGVMGGLQLGVSSGSSSVVGALPTPAPAPVTPAPAPAPNAPAPAPAPAPAKPAPAPRTSLPRTGVEEAPMRELALVLALVAVGLGAVVVRSSRRSTRV